MRKVRALLLFVCIVASSVSFALANDGVVQVVSAEFGLFDVSHPKEFRFHPSDSVPHREGQRYGWVIGVRTKKRSVSVREEYLVATAATIAGPSGDPATGGLNIPLPRRNQVSQRQLVPVGGKIYGEWSIGPGEPPGKRHLQVIVEGQLAGDFEYEVK